MFTPKTINRKLSNVLYRSISKQGLLNDFITFNMKIYDTLTGVATLPYVMDLGNKILDGGSNIVVLVIGLDKLRYYNNTYGHILTNNLLINFAQNLQTKANSIDAMVGRLGGDEFVVLKEIKNPINEISLREEIFNSLKDELYAIDTSIEPFKVSFSIGEAFTIDGMHTSIHKLLQKAEADMNYNKYKSRSDIIGVVRNADLFKNQSSQLLMVLAEKDMYTYMHSQSVAKFAAEFAKYLNLPDYIIENIYFAGWLHDIGKVVITSEILRKPTRLDQEEYHIIKQHVNNGLNIIKTYNFPETVRNAILYHHERWDGNGYPNGILGKDTPIEGRILQIIDAFSAMTVKRVYREQLTMDNAIEEIVRNSGTQFDPRLAETFIELITSEKLAI